MARDMFEMGLLTRVFPDDEFEAKFEEVVRNISSKKPNALRMAKEVMAKSVECGSIDTALAMERNAIQWLVYSPDIQAVMDGFRQDPDQLTKTQKEENIASDVKS